MMIARQFCSLLFTKRFFTNASPLCSYESGASLKKIYPNSSLDFTRSVPAPLSKTDGPFTGYIPIEELDITYSKSSGPGGQNVNKVNTKVDLRFNLQNAKWLPQSSKSNLEEQHKKKLNSEGYFIVKSDRTRSQQMNLADALDKLRYMIHRADYVIPVPSYKTLEIHRRRQEKATRERLRQKRNKSLIKKDRQGLDMDF